jgi:hypothetical protein
MCRGSRRHDGRRGGRYPSSLGGKDPGTLGAIKHTVFEHTMQTLTTDADDPQRS